MTLRSTSAIPLSAVTNNTTVPSGSAVALSSSSVTRVTNASLAAGTWLVWGVVDLALNAATITTLQAGLSNSPISFVGQGGGGGIGPDANTIPAALPAATTTATVILQIAPVIVTLASAANVYLNVMASISAGTVGAYGTLYYQQISAVL
jgi:hypothetical protein